MAEKVGVIDIHADRWVSCVRSFSFIDLNLTGASYAAQVRRYPDTAEAALATFTTALTYSGSTTVSAHITADRLRSIPPGLELTDSVHVSVLKLTIAEATMEAMPFPGERGDDAEFAWDLHITPSGGTKDKYLGGKFIVRAGATQ